MTYTHWRYGCREKMPKTSYDAVYDGKNATDIPVSKRLLRTVNSIARNSRIGFRPMMVKEVPVVLLINRISNWGYKPFCLRNPYIADNPAKRSSRIVVTLNDKWHERLCKLAKACDMPRAEVLRNLLINTIEWHKFRKKYPIRVRFCWMIPSKRNASNRWKRAKRQELRAKRQQLRSALSI